MTNDTTWNIWQDGIQNELITSLTNSEELRVRQTESINNLIRSNGLTNYASITPSVASKISQKLDADVYIIGTIKQAGYTIRINAQLIDLKTEEVFKSFQMSGKTENILHIIDSLSVEIKNFLIMSELKKEHSYETDATISTKSPEAYRYYLNGLKSFIADDFTSARNMFFQSLAIDPNFTDVIFYTSTSYGNQGLYEQAKKWCLVAYTKKDLMPMRGKLYTNWLYANYFETPNEAIKYLRQIQELDDQEPTAYFLLGNAYLGLYQYDKAIPEYEKLLGIYKKWDLKPHWVYNYTYLGHAYHETGQYNKEINVYKKAERDFPDNPVLIYRQAVLALSEGNLSKANSCIDRFISVSKESSSSEAEIGTNVSGNFSSEAAIARNIAEIYSEANMLNKAEVYSRQALSLEPESSHRLNDLAYFLVEKDRNIKEGLELADKALEISPDDYNYLHTKGWGLYKQGRIKEALDVLQKSWDLRMKNAIYDHEAFLHLEAAKKAFTRSF
jgi:tetratricopeptide (TPR) repeat protein